jgi:2'-5' RNA ligase
MSSWRLFCAVELPAEVRKQLEEHVLKLRKAVPDVAASWSRVENIHLTLKFFGNVALDRIPVISAAASRAAGEFSAFRIGVGNTGVFPRPSRAQVLWIGVSDPSGKLSAMQERLENAPQRVSQKKLALIDHTSRSLVSGVPKAPDASSTLIFK